jgi:hypothetical protein
MEDLKSILRGSFAKSLGALNDEDKVAAAWPVACGSVLASRGVVVGYTVGVMRVEVPSGAWMREMMSVRAKLEHEIARISGVRIVKIEFVSKRTLS